METICSIVSACVAVLGLVYTIYRDVKRNNLFFLLSNTDMSIYLVM